MASAKSLLWERMSSKVYVNAKEKVRLLPVAVIRGGSVIEEARCANFILTTHHKPPKAATVKITKSFNLYEEAGTIYFSYTEHSSDYWHSNSQTDVEIDKEKAKEIIDFLSEKFKITPL